MTKSLASRYVEALSAACIKGKIKEFSLVHGASETDLNRLREKFPDVPETLVQLLSLVDGTYYRKYKRKKIRVAFFDGIDGHIPYYLNSVEQILEQDGSSIAAMYGDPDPEDRTSPEYLADFMDMVGEGIDPFQPFGTMLHLSDCTNNGGSSALYIDFHPAEGGVKGQIVCFMHDPDRYFVVAPSFDAFLEARLEAGFGWIEGAEDEEEIPEDPDMDALLEGLEANDPQAVEQLQHPFARKRIVDIMRAAPTPAVLRACLQRLYEYVAECDEPGMLKDIVKAHYHYLSSEFCKYSAVYLNDAPLREEVTAFALKVRNVVLIRQLGLEMTSEEAMEIFRDNCHYTYAYQRYKALSPEDFFHESALAWNKPGFDDFFLLSLNYCFQFAPYAFGKRERVLHLHPDWKTRLRDCNPPATMNFAVLADMANTVEDLEWLTHWCADSAHKEQMMRLANFCHALCLVGEEQVDAYLPWLFEQVLTALRANPDYFDYRFNSEPLSFKYAVKDLKNNEQSVSDFTFIVSLRLEKSLELLAHIDSMLTEEAGKKACASLVRLLKKKIKEAKA